MPMRSDAKAICPLPPPLGVGARVAVIVGVPVKGLAGRTVVSMVAVLMLVGVVVNVAVAVAEARTGNGVGFGAAVSVGILVGVDVN